MEEVSAHDQTQSAAGVDVDISDAHLLITRQLQQAGLAGETSPELRALIAMVEQTYRDFAETRRLYDQSIQLAADKHLETIESLASSERLFRSLARCSPNGILHIDFDGGCLYANDRALELVERSAEEVAGQGWMKSVPVEDHDLFFTIDSADDDGIDRLVEHRVVRPSGDVIWVATVIGTLRDVADNGVGWVVSFEDITERKERERELAMLASRDSLTQLLNRHALRERLDELFEIRTATSRLAIALLDLDRFKLVNDTFGHEAGDELLIAVARLLRALVGEHNVIARVGGDEFVVATMLDTATTPAAFGKSLADALNRPIDIGSRVVDLGASVGVACAEGRRGTRSDLLHAADAAMYRAKRSRDRSYEVADLA